MLKKLKILSQLFNIKNFKIFHSPSDIIVLYLEKFNFTALFILFNY